MSTRLQQGQLITQANTNGFLAQVIGSLISYAASILTEGAAVPNHTNRLAFAQGIVTNPSNIAQMILPLMLANINIATQAGTPANIADADVDSQIASIYNAVANYYVALGTLNAFRVGS